VYAGIWPYPFRYPMRKLVSADVDPDRVANDLRRTAVRNLECAGVSRSAAMKMAGHKTESIYRRYAIVDEAMLREGAEKLAAFHAVNRATQGTVVALKTPEQPQPRAR
jgi:hypothetical protein